MSRRETIIRNSLWRIADGFEIMVRPTASQPFPLSALESVRVAIDGEWQAPERIWIALGEDEYQVTGLAERCGEIWPAPKAAAVCEHGAPRPVPGPDHPLAIALADRVDGAAEATTDRYVTIETAA